MSAPTIHLIGNAHLDPVWLWDWREGLNEGLATCRTMVALLHEFPEARFMRGEAAIYEHVARHDPALFAEIRALVAAGRWEIVGGTYIQPDENLPATEALLRQFVVGRKYFRETFGVEVTSAWSADCFGHSGGFPEILRAAGIDSFAFTRPWGTIPGLDKPAFWWRGAGGARILCYRPLAGWYGTERDEVERRLDVCLEEAMRTGMHHVGCFYGLGNHGGGPTRVHLRQIAAWAARHPEVRVVHSGLHDLFAAVRAELIAQGESILPELVGELNFCLRGCAASVAKFKFLYRRVEAQVFRAERTLAASTAATRRPAMSLAEIWRTLLFNAFHDILPGTSIERAYDDQIAQLGAVQTTAQRAEHDAVLDLAAQIDTRSKRWAVAEDQPQPVPLLVWNPHPFPLRTHVEFEVSLDYRPLWAYRDRANDVPVQVTDDTGRIVAAQTVREEHDSMAGLPWRSRAVVPVEVPPLGWRVYQMGLAAIKPAPPPASRVEAVSPDTIGNGTFTIAATPDTERVRFTRDGAAWLGDGLGLRVYDDPWGSWGGMNEETESFLLMHERERWKIVASHVLEAGPERAALWVRFSGARSSAEFTFLLLRDTPYIEVRARILFVERSARLKLVFPAPGEAEFEVPGGTARRQPSGEVPGGRWVRIAGTTAFGFASDALYGFDATAEEFRATIARASRYASDVKTRADERPWLPAVDAGELRFKFLLTADLDRLPAMAALLEEPPIVVPVPARAGERPAVGSLGGDLSAGLRLLALRPLDANSIELRVQNASDTTRAAEFAWLGSRLALGEISRCEIATWLLQRADDRWQAKRVPATGESAEPSDRRRLTPRAPQSRRPEKPAPV